MRDDNGSLVGDDNGDVKMADNNEVVIVSAVRSAVGKGKKDGP